MEKDREIAKGIIMKNYQFSKSIDHESTKEFLDFLGTNAGEDVNLYLCSNGGGIGYGKMIQYAIEEHGKVKIIACVAICSTAFVFILFH